MKTYTLEIRSIKLYNGVYRGRVYTESVDINAENHTTANKIAYSIISDYKEKHRNMKVSGVVNLIENGRIRFSFESSPVYLIRD